jgi:hypothetical protein
MPALHAVLLLLATAAPPQEAVVAIPATGTLPPAAAARTSGGIGADVAQFLDAVRRVRAASDSALAAYDVRLYHRAAVSAVAGPYARERTLVQLERVEHVRWSRGEEPRIEVVAVRRTTPALDGDRPRLEPLDIAGELIELPSLPFYPGNATLWPEPLLGPSPADSTDAVLDPLDPGAESSYRYSLRRPRAVRTPDGRSRNLQELRIRPVHAQPTLLVADLWFDPTTLVLVRAAYRPSGPIDIIARKLAPAQRSGLLRWTSPARVAVRSIVVEYESRGDSISLPRARTLEAVLDVPFLRVPLRVEQGFEYAEVRVSHGDTTQGATATAATAGATPGQPLPSAARPGVRNGGRLVWLLPVADSAALADPRRLRDSASGPAGARLPAGDFHDRSTRLGAIRPRWNPRAPEFRHLSDLAGRYNRVQGPSVRFGTLQELPLLSLEASIRVPLAEPIPEGEVTLTPAGGSGHPRLSLYRRLTAANEWDDPLGLGNSLSALLLARDDGLYFRTTGLEVVGGSHELAWRIFDERQSSAHRHVSFTLPALFSGKLLTDRPLQAETGRSLGASLRSRRLTELPAGWRLGSDARLEVATGDAAYGRLALDVTGTRAIGRGLALALTAGAGGSAGHLPIQRLWYLGGSQSVRGFNPGDAAGRGYWRIRGELGLSSPGLRPALFTDLGAAADHMPWQRTGPTLVATGVSLSFLDGLIRLDFARALHPASRWWAGATTDAWF